MRLDDIHRFNNTVLGTHTIASISTALAPHLQSDSDSTQILGIGCVVEYLGDIAYTHVLPPVYYDTFHYIDLFKSVRTVVADDDHLPFRNNSVHMAVLIHALEHADSPWAMMAEINRLIVSGGRVIVVVPNRVSMWSRIAKVPFSHGQPYTKKQLENVMNMAGFVPITHTYSVFFPPCHIPMQTQITKFCNKLGKYFWQENGGVIIGIYEKQVARRVKQAKPYTKLSGLGATIIPTPKITTQNQNKQG